jgi:hypothetical protein
MNKLTTLSIAALTMFGTIQAMAAETSVPLTRAQVVAETQRAQAAGELSGGDSFSFPTSAAPAATKLSREAVKAEYRRALAAGEVNNGDSLSFPFEQRAESKLTRAEVFAEYVRARQAGELVETDVDGSVTHQRGVM